MIVTNGKHYLYRHIRLDKNEPFYIGIGTKSKKYWNSLTSEYRRAYERHNENSIWSSIINKSAYKIEILLESNDYEFIKKKEQEFIRYYGRINKKTGLLANFTDGGDGQLGRVLSTESKEKIRLKLKGVKLSEERCQRMRDLWKTKVHPNKGKKYVNGKKVYQYSLDGNFLQSWRNGMEAAEVLSLQCTSIYRSACGHRKGHGGYLWSYEKKEKIQSKEHYKMKTKVFRKGQKIIGTDINSGQTVVVSNIEELENIVKSSANVFKCIRGERKTAGGFKWKIYTNHAD